MDKKIILRTSNGIGNQMFMYASAFAIAKKLGRNLLIDNETAFKDTIASKVGDALETKRKEVANTFVKTSETQSDSGDEEVLFFL